MYYKKKFSPYGRSWLGCLVLWLGSGAVCAAPAQPPLLFGSQEALGLPLQADCNCNQLKLKQVPKAEMVPAQLRLTELMRYLSLPAALPLASVVFDGAQTAEGAKNVENSTNSENAEGVQGLESLQSMAQWAMTYSLDIEGSRQRLASFEWTRNAAAGNFLPKVNLRLSKGEGTLYSNNPQITLPREENTLTISQTLLDEPARQEWRRQDRLVSSAGYQLDAKVSGILLEVSTAYLNALQSNIGVKLSQSYEKTLSELANYIGERAKVGGASGADAERVRSRVSNLRGVLANDVAALKTALANLERLTGQCPLAFDLRASPPGLVLPPELETALEQAKERNADFLAANAELAAAESERNKSQNSFYPKLSLDYTELQTRNTSGTESYVKDSKVALNATFSIFNGGIDRNQFNAGQARVNELLTQSGALERKLRSDLQGAYFNLYSVNKRFETVGEELQSNQKVVDAFSAQLSASNRQLLDVLDAQQRLHQSKLDLLQNVIRQAQIQLQISHWTGALKSGLLP